MPKFKLGRVVSTRNITNKKHDNIKFRNFVDRSFKRYVSCDWGDVNEADKKRNDNAVNSGDSRIFAAYINQNTGDKIWIITEADRSVTTILFPSEY